MSDQSPAPTPHSEPAKGTDPSVPLSDLPYEEVKSRAIHLAEKRHDVGFFYDLFRHTPAMNAAQSEGGSLGDFSGSILEMVDAARELFGKGNVGDLEPLFRARFEEYLTEHGEG